MSSSPTSILGIWAIFGQSFPVSLWHLLLNLGQSMIQRFWSLFKLPKHSGITLMFGQSRIINIRKEFVDPWRNWVGNAIVAGNPANSTVWRESGWISFSFLLSILIKSRFSQLIISNFSNAVRYFIFRGGNQVITSINKQFDQRWSRPTRGNMLICLL